MLNITENTGSVSTTPIEKKYYEESLTASPATIRFAFQDNLGSHLIPETSLTGSLILEKNSASTRIIYNNVTYTLKSVQIAGPRHSSLVINNSKETSATLLPIAFEMVIIFENESQQEKYVFFVIPLIYDTLPVNDEPLYLTRIKHSPESSSSTSEPSINLGQCFPKNSTTLNVFYINYKTCLKYKSNTNTITKASIFVCAVGKRISTITFTNIKTKYIGTTFSLGLSTGGAFYLDNIETTEISNVKKDDLQKYISTVQILNDDDSLGIISQQYQTYDNARNYQCVELNPENISDNMDVDKLLTGNTPRLDEIKAEYDAVKAIVVGTDSSNVSKWGYALTVFILCIIFAGIGFSVYQYNYGENTFYDKSNADFIEIGFFSVAFILLLAGSGLLLLNKEYTIGGVILGVGVLISVLNYLFFHIIYPRKLPESTPAAATPAAATPAAAAAAADADANAWFTKKSLILVGLFFIFGTISGGLIASGSVKQV